MSCQSGGQQRRLRSPALLVALAAAALLGGCGATTKSASTGQPTASTSRLRIGQSATLQGVRSGERIQVTLLAFAPSVRGGANDHPEFDMQYAGADLKLTNVGSVAYANAPDRSVTVISSEGQNSKSAQLTEGSCSERFARAVLIAPGASAQGCVPVQVPVVASVATLRFAPDGDGAGHVAEWSLTRSAKKSHSAS